MTRNERIEYHINAIAQEVFGYISENSDGHENGWISAVRIKDDLITRPMQPAQKSARLISDVIAVINHFQIRMEFLYQL